MIATMLTIARTVQATGDAPGHGCLGEQQDKQKVRHEGLPSNFIAEKSTQKHATSAEKK